MSFELIAPGGSGDEAEFTGKDREKARKIDTWQKVNNTTVITNDPLIENETLDFELRRIKTFQDLDDIAYEKIFYD